VFLLRDHDGDQDCAGDAGPGHAARASPGAFGKALCTNTLVSKSGMGKTPRLRAKEVFDWNPGNRTIELSAAKWAQAEASVTGRKHRSVHGDSGPVASIPHRASGAVARSLITDD
jgi:hypothetical protein